MNRALWALAALNFFMADMQAGIGPFLGVFLLAHSWQAGAIGTVMTIGGIAGLIMIAPAGALIDSTSHKRMWVIVSGLSSILASALIFWSQEFWLVALSLVATQVAGCAVGPAVNGITLGLVRQKGFNRQLGRNQAFNHAGNAAGAALSGYLGLRYGFAAVLWLAAAFGVASVICTLIIPPEMIDNSAARGLKEDSEDAQVSGMKALFRSTPMLILAAGLFAFHLGNAAMLPLYGMAMAAKGGDGNGAWDVAMTIIVAQGAMVFMSLASMRMIEKKSAWLAILLSFISLPIRGFLASRWISSTGVYPVQLLDGVGAGLQSVAVPVTVARVLKGTGRVNVGQGALMTVQGLGSSLSPAIGGWMVQFFGYSWTFLVLGCFALGSIAVWIRHSGQLKEACV
jgi:MFS family permease